MTKVASGSAITLTATVTAGGFSAGLFPGQVKFCDATAVHCTDIQIIGSGQVTSAGTATFSFVPEPGSHSYNAVFVGKDGVAASTSATQSLTVTHTRLYPSGTSLSYTG